MVGVIENVDDAVGNCFVAAEQDICVIGQGDKTDDGWLGASIYQQHHGDDGIYAPPPLDLVAEQKTGSFVRQQILGGGISARMTSRWRACCCHCRNGHAVWIWR
jgi:phosphoribosylformylglycinamidine synthase